MEKFSQIAQPPIAKKYSYSQVPKAVTLTKSRHLTIQPSEYLKETPSFQINSTPKKSYNVSVYREITRLEEELDCYEINQNNYSYKEIFDEKQKEKDLKTYEKFFEGIIYCIGQIDMRISKCLCRGWNSYQRVVNTKIRKESNISTISEVLIKVKKDAAVQVDDIFAFISKDEDFDNYISILNSLTTRIGNMNHNKVVKALRKLLVSLKPIDIPNHSSMNLPSKSKAESFRDLTIKNSDHLNKNSMPAKVGKLGNLHISKVTQTGLTSKDIDSYEYLKVLVKEKDTVINTMNEKLEKLIIYEKALNALQEDSNDHKARPLELLKTPYKEWKDQEIQKGKRESLLNKTAEVDEKSNKIIINASPDTELKKTKSRLRGSSIEINKTDNYTNEQSENIDNQTKKVKNLISQREALEKKLSEEQAKTLLLEEELEKTLKNKSQLKTALKDLKESEKSNSKSPSTSPKSKIIHRNISSKEKFTEPNESYDLNYTTEKLRHRLPEGYFKNKLLLNDISPKITTQDSHESFTINTSRNIKPRLSGYHVNSSVNYMSHNNKYSNETRQDMIMRILNLTQIEYLGLSKKARLEIFEVLLNHKGRCGTECEHLKRAMMIRYRDKGTLYPTKKLNIVKE